MRILYFTRSYTTHDWRFLSALAETEHKVFYLRLLSGDCDLEHPPLPPQIDQLYWTGCRGQFTWLDAPRLARDLKSIIRSVKPDLIHAGPIQSAAFLIAWIGFKPLVSMSWGYDLLVDAERNVVWSWATRFTFQRSTLMVGDCETIRKQAIFYGMKDERIVTFPWGVDLEHFSPNEVVIPSLNQTPSLRLRFGWGENAFVLLSTRGWETIYGVEIIASAFADAAKINPNVHLVMLGNGSQADLLRDIFLQANVLEQVHFPGQISQAELPDYYRSADLYVSASHSDGSSISLLEAMASGLPVLVSDIPGNQEWVEPGVNGWWFKDGDTENLKRAILLAADMDRSKRIDMGRAGRKLVESRAHWKVNFPKLLKAYDLAMSIDS